MHFSSISGGISLPSSSIFCYCIKKLHSLPSAFLIEPPRTHHLDVLFVIQGKSLVKIWNNLSNIQTMMRESVEKVLISFPYNSKRFTRFFRKVLDCSHECISTFGREKFIQKFISHVFPSENLIGSKRLNHILAFSFRENGNKTIQMIWRGNPVERKSLQTSSKSLMNE